MRSVTWDVWPIATVGQLICVVFKAKDVRKVWNGENSKFKRHYKEEIPPQPWWLDREELGMVLKLGDEKLVWCWKKEANQE